MTRSFLPAHGAAPAAYLLLTLALTWPLAAQLDVSVPSDNGDPLLSTWTLWWNASRVPFTDGWWNGPIFVPAPDVLSYSDHRVGLGLVASPVMWLGGSPLTAHNLTFLSSFLFSALAMYALAFAVTRRRDAAFLAGLVFAFHPFRADHLAHLELLASYWLPMALLALHRWLDTDRRGWLVAAAAALTLQALTCGYYFVFGGVLVGLWVLWFVPGRMPRRRYPELAAALAAPLVLMSPVLWHYHTAHEAQGLARSIGEIEELSADIAGFVTAPARLLVWGGLQTWPGSEGALFPGVTAVLLVGIAIWRGRGDRAVTPTFRDAWPAWRRVCLGLAVAVALVAAVPALAGPVRLDLGLVRVSVSDAYKPLSIAALLLIAVVSASPALHAAWRVRSPLAFYALATLVMWACALGPTARFVGHRAFYKAPYAWLMALPGFADEFRSPARFAMLGALTLAVAAAVAFVRVSRAWPPRTRAAVFGVVTLGILADGWVAPFPLVEPPARLEIPAAVPIDAVILELPLGVFEDAAAMYRGIAHGHPVANGLSGYQPPHYAVLQAALRDSAFEVVDALAPDAPLAIFVDRATDARSWTEALARSGHVRQVGATATHDVLLRDPVGPSAKASPVPPPDRHLPIAALTASDSPDAIGRAIDGNPATIWATDGAQQGGETVTAELKEAAAVAGVLLTLERNVSAFPRALAISVSADGQTWTEVWRGPTARPTMATSLADTGAARVHLPFPPVEARFVRLVQTARAAEAAWVIAELAVLR